MMIDSGNSASAVNASRNLTMMVPPLVMASASML